MDAEIGERRIALNGAPVGSAAFCSKHTSERTVVAQRTLDAIAQIADPQVGLKVLRSCAGFALMVYSMPVVPPALHAGLCSLWTNNYRSALTSSPAYPHRRPSGHWLAAAPALLVSGFGLPDTTQRRPFWHPQLHHATLVVSLIPLASGTLGARGGKSALPWLPTMASCLLSALSGLTTWKTSRSATCPSGSIARATGRSSSLSAQRGKLQ